MKALVPLLAIVGLIGCAPVGASDPCTHKTFAELNERHPELKKLWNHHVLAAEALYNKHQAEDARLELARHAAELREDREAELRIVEAQAKVALQHAEVFSRLSEIQDEQYDTECRRLEGQ